jgi:hypothetical protein
VLLDLGEREEAMPHFRTLIDISTRAQGEDDSVTQTLIQRYLAVLVSLEPWGEARAVQERVVAHCERTKGQWAPETTMVAWQLLRIAQAQGDDNAVGLILAAKLFWLLLAGPGIWTRNPSEAFRSSFGATWS